MAIIVDNLQAIRERLGTVTLLAVSKGQSLGKVREAAAAGQRAFGENYVQEALEKMQQLQGLEWHLIGPLQSNKTRAAAEHFDWVQTVASEKIARRLSEQRPAGRSPLNVLVQLNASGTTPILSAPLLVSAVVARLNEAPPSCSAVATENETS